MRSRRRFNAGSGANRRRTTWATVDNTFVLAANNDYATFDLLSGFKADGGVQQAVTVARTHLSLTVIDSGNDGADQFAWGLIRGQSTDIGANVAGAPTPVADPYEDWAFWDLRTCDADGHYWPGGGNTYIYDIKSMRKLEELQMSYNMVVLNITATAPFSLQVSGRVLLMLP